MKREVDHFLKDLNREEAATQSEVFRRLVERYDKR
jgi:hypothetical protein